MDQVASADRARHESRQHPSLRAGPGASSGARARPALVISPLEVSTAVHRSGSVMRLSSFFLTGSARTDLPIMSIPCGREQQGCSVTNLQGTLSLEHISSVNSSGSFLLATWLLPLFSVSFSVWSTRPANTLLPGVGEGGGLVVGGGVGVVVVVVVEVVDRSKKCSM